MNSRDGWGSHCRLAIEHATFETSAAPTACQQDHFGGFVRFCHDLQNGSSYPPLRPLLATINSRQMYVVIVLFKLASSHPLVVASSSFQLLSSLPCI